MAITCNWKHKLGTCYGKYDYEQKEQLTIYGGENCTAIICFANKNLYSFIIDKEHLKKMAIYNNNCEMKNVKLFITNDKKLNSEIKKLAKMFIDCNIEFSYIKGE